MRGLIYTCMLFALAGMLFWVVSCTTSQVREASPVVSKEAPKPQVVVQTTAKPEAPEGKEGVEDLFEMEIKPLTPAECARCHYPIFKLLKEAGGKHKQVCTNCHEVYHRKKWKEIMPKCEKCHQLPHGEQSKDCLSCHEEPHTPRRIELASVEGKCELCHGAETKELVEHTSAHQEVGCEGCHAEMHGRIPHCFDCHEEGHVKDQTQEECLQCHSPHSPKDIKPFKGLKVENRVCGSCHEVEFHRLATTTTKHGQQACIFCHPKHGLRPRCEGCHGKPHFERLHQKFPKCVKCHKDPHSLRKPKAIQVKPKAAKVK